MPHRVAKWALTCVTRGRYLGASHSFKMCCRWSVTSRGPWETDLRFRFRGLLLVVRDACGLNQGRVKSVVVAHFVDKALAAHLSIQVTHGAVWRFDPLHHPVVAPNLRLFVELAVVRSEEHTSELQSLRHLVCR